MEDKFFDYIEEKFKSYDGFISFMPNTREKYMKAIENVSDNDDFARALSEVILYEMSDVISDDYEKDYLDDVWEYASENGMEEYEDD